MLSNSEKACEIKRQVSLMNFLAKLGFHPKKTHGNEAMYISMIRESDTKPSFSVNEKLGAWYDHGLGKGGDIFDLAMLYWKGLKFHEAVEKVQEVCSLPRAEQSSSRNINLRPRLKVAVKLPNYQIREIKPFGSTEVINAYLRSRGVFDAASTQLAEVHYYVVDEKKLRKEFFAAGWQNELGGWEVRNKYFKGCLGKKAITFIPGYQRELAVFEGYFDYLSWKTENPASSKSILVLNAVALIELGIKKAKLFSDIELYMDHDTAGYKALNAWKTALPYSTDKSGVYQKFNDYNDKLAAALKAKRMKNINW
ncbi:toprim domain-containing protein [Pedobacter foliorum]|uniref:toprim domain-containing protein n=1 Tax=Pedobacter foliorum TaxID=2739058 RepID=UPI001567163C|nr:toprim domain-containing protein [Pedobacter foliorum]NRF37567.1 toprim domain-containing protein [Pedobacter foliorum]